MSETAYEKREREAKEFADAHGLHDHGGYASTRTDDLPRDAVAAPPWFSIYYADAGNKPGSYVVNGPAGCPSRNGVFGGAYDTGRGRTSFEFSKRDEAWDAYQKEASDGR